MPLWVIGVFVLSMLLIASQPFLRTFILRRYSDNAPGSRFLSYRWAAISAGVTAVVFVLWLVLHGTGRH